MAMPREIAVTLNASQMPSSPNARDHQARQGDTHRRHGRAHDLRPERVARTRQRSFQDQLKALADLRERDDPQVRDAVGDHLRVPREQREETAREKKEGVDRGSDDNYT